MRAQSFVKPLSIITADIVLVCKKERAVLSAIFSGLIAMLLVYCIFRHYTGDAGVVFEIGDPRLEEAKRKARASLPAFWSALEKADHADDDFMLKFNLNHRSGLEDNESIWAYEIACQNGRIFGKLGNSPINPGFCQDQFVEIDPEAIDDWGYYRDGVAQGHFATRVMIEASPAGTARVQRKQMGW